jgi:hypothetical protein
MMHMAALGFSLAATAAGFGAEVQPPAIRGPLRVHPANSRYFTDDSGKAILLVGSHTWNNLQDMGETDPPTPFDFDGYLDFLVRHGHNFIRLWRWELTSWHTTSHVPKPRTHFAAPHPWPRTGPGTALDGKPKFDLSRFDEAYFRRLRARVDAARKRGIYVSVMLFEGWGMQFVPDAWKKHPFHPANSINGPNLDAEGNGLDIHTFARPEVTRLQEAYVRKVVDTVGGFDNVLYEIGNETHPSSTAWQYHMIRFIHEYEKSKRKRHPVGMTFQFQGGSNQTLFDSPADWISPNPEAGPHDYRTNPPPADGRKVVLSDTDHLWGIGGNTDWVWKTFLRGHNPLFMDPYKRDILEGGTFEQWEPIRRALGVVLSLSRRTDLASMTPADGAASSGYCLAKPGAEYVVYLPNGGDVNLDISAATGMLAVEWIHPVEGTVTRAPAVAGGSKVTFKAPFGGPAVVHLYKQPESQQSP